MSCAGLVCVIGQRARTVGSAYVRTYTRIELMLPFAPETMKRSNSKAPGLKAGLIPQQSTQAAPEGWAEAQREIAEASAISLLLVDGYQPPALVITNNNSICEALQSSPEHVKLCDPFCGEAHARAIRAEAITHYKCHAGLQCFAMPIEIETQRKLVVIGGRAFARGSDYREALERFRSGDLKALAADEIFQNIIFADEADLDHAALRISKAAGSYQPLKNSPHEELMPVVSVDIEPEPERATHELMPVAEPTAIETEASETITLADSIRKFAEQIDASDPLHTYQSIVARSADLVHAERGSLLLFDAAENRLTMTAAQGIPAAVSEVAPIAVGQGIAGVVLRENRQCSPPSMNWANKVCRSASTRRNHSSAIRLLSATGVLAY